MPVKRDDKGVESWMDDAACKGMDPALFHPESGGGVARDYTLPGSPRVNQNIMAAVETCKRCRVDLACLEYAIRNRLKDGIYGGMTGRGRRGLRFSGWGTLKYHAQKIRGW